MASSWLNMMRYIKRVNNKVVDKTYPDDYFDVNINILTIATLWVPVNFSKVEFFIYRAFSAYSFFYCIIFCTPSEFISLPYTWSDQNAFINNLGIALTHAIANVKVINWWVRRKEILVLMDTLNSQKYHYEDCDDFEPGLIVQQKKQINISLSTMFFWLSINVPISGYLSGFFNFGYNIESFYEDGEFKCISFPFYSWIPFDHSTEWGCILAMFFQAFPMIYLTLMIIATDTTFMSLINYITAHLLVLQGAFKTVRTRAVRKLKRHNDVFMLHDDEELSKEMMQGMKKCIDHLQTCHKFVSFMEDVYSMQTLGQVFVSCFVICTCLFLISTVPVTSKTFLVEVIYVLAIEYQLTLYCWFGNELTLASIGIPMALYQSDWLSADFAYKQCVMITMLRMNRKVCLTVGKFSPLNLETLVAILRGSYSLYALLENTKEEIEE